MTRRLALALTLDDLGPALVRCGVRVAMVGALVGLVIWRLA